MTALIDEKGINSITPPNVNKTLFLANGSSITQQSYHYAREVLETEVFPNKDPDLGSQITNLALLDIAYYPEERGQYNYNTDLLQSGFLKDPKSNFGAITKSISNDTDFDKTNIQYLENLQEIINFQISKQKRTLFYG